MTKRLHSTDIKKLIEAEMAQNDANRQRTGTGNPLPPGEPGDFNGMAVIRLRVADVEPYEDNPRQALNPQFDEIKDSIRARGLDQRLIVTKRPGAQRYILAKGGKTRLKALQELALEDPARFERIDFELVKYVSESELLVAHMVENVQHASMTFWDTAAGFLLLRAKRSKELQRTVSDSEFATELKALGFKVDRIALGEFEFLHQVLLPLDKYVYEIGSSDIRNVLRPQFNSLYELATRLNQIEKPVFEKTYKTWLETFAAKRPLESDQDGATEANIKFDSSRLAQHIARSAAEFLDLTESELTAAQAALSKDRKIDAAGLRAAIAAATAQPETTSSSPGDEGSTTVTTTGGDSDTAWTSGSGTDFGAADGGGDDTTVSTTGTTGTTGTSDADSTGGAGSYRPPAPGGSARVPDGLSGVTPVPKSLVHTLIPLDKNGKPINQDAGNDAAQAPQGVQGTLPGTTTLEQAIEAFRDAVEALTHFAGIQDLLVPARTPMTFYMEAPQRPLGDDAADYAVLAWWFLANFTGQLSQEVFSLTVEEDGQTVLALPDTGPNGWRQIVGDNERLQQFAASHLGGVALIDGCHIINLMTDPHSSMAELALEVVRTAAVWRLHKGY